MASKTNIPYVEKGSAEEHLIEIRSNGIITADMADSNVKVKCMVHQSSYQYGGIRRAINHVYILERVKMPERIKRELSTFIVRMERTLIVENQMLGLNISKEKNHQPQFI